MSEEPLDLDLERLEQELEQHAWIHLEMDEVRALVAEVRRLRTDLDLERRAHDAFLYSWQRAEDRLRADVAALWAVAVAADRYHHRLPPTEQRCHICDALAALPRDLELRRLPGTAPGEDA